MVGRTNNVFVYFVLESNKNTKISFKNLKTHFTLDQTRASIFFKNFLGQFNLDLIHTGYLVHYTKTQKIVSKMYLDIF